MKNLFRRAVALIALALASLVAAPAMAAGATSGTVTVIYAMPGDVFMFLVAASSTGQPGCATQASRYAIDVSTAGGRAKMDVVMVAYLSGRTVTVAGLNSCALWADSETVSLVYAI